MMQNSPYKDFEFITTSVDVILNTDDDIVYGYYLFCDIEYSDICKDKTDHLALLPFNTKRDDSNLGYIERVIVRARAQKLILDQKKYE